MTDVVEAEPTEFVLWLRDFGRRQNGETHEAAPRPTPERPNAHLPSGDEQPRGISDPFAYGRRALDSAIENVRASVEGFRNHTLNAAAYSMGRLVGGGLLDESSVVDALSIAADECGLEHRETRLTIASGLSAGCELPIAWTLNAAEHVPLLRADGTGSHPQELRVVSDEQLLANELRLQRARRAAKVILDDEERAATRRLPPVGFRGDEFETQDDEQLTWLLDGVLPLGGNVTLTAPYKTGKTSLVGELVRSLCDEVPFLATYDVVGMSGGVGIWDYEMHTGMHRRWLRDLRIENKHGYHVRHIRGFGIDLLSDDGTAEAIDWLREREIGIWLLDPFTRAYLSGAPSGRDENDNGEVTRWTDRLDVIKQAAGVHSLVMPIHTGRREGGDMRARGATRLDDWPDVRWLLKRASDGDRRSFSALGRDVEISERVLTYDIETRRLAVDVFAVDAEQESVSDAAERLWAILPSREGSLSGMSQNSAYVALGVRKGTGGGREGYVSAAADWLEKHGRAVVNRRSNGWQMWRV